MATHDPDDVMGGSAAMPDPDSGADPATPPAAPGGPVLASQIPVDVANTPGAGDIPLIPTVGTPPPGDPGGTAAGGALDTGPNPVIGTPHTPRIEVPQGVIHSINAVPGEANPTLHGTSAGAAGPPATTAELLAEREDAEEQWQEGGAGVRARTGGGERRRGDAL